MRRIIAVVEIETMRRGHCKYFLSGDHKCLFSQYPTDCLWLVPDWRSAQDSRLAAAIVCRILATAAALVGGTGGFSTDRRRVTAANHVYFVLQYKLVFIGLIEPSPTKSKNKSKAKRVS